MGSFVNLLVLALSVGLALPPWCSAASTRRRAVAEVEPVTRRMDVPPVTRYFRRAFMNTVVLGNYLYIDGGEVSMSTNGNPPGTKEQPSYAVNTTLSIDLTVAWGVSTVTMATTNKKAPLMDLQSMWVDQGSNSFYTWAGQTPYGTPPSRTNVWKFTADGSGGGSWATSNASNEKIESGLIRTADAAFTTANGVGYSFGGLAGSWSDSVVPGGQQPVAGMVTYDISSKTFTNESGNALGPSYVQVGTKAQFVTGYGSNASSGGGFIFTLGGLQTTTTPFVAFSDPGAAVYLDFSNITFYDPSTQRWHWQVATGDLPAPRHGHCLVGVSASNNSLSGGISSYEIFLFAGQNSITSSMFSDAFVLSIPGFVWTRIADSAAPRSRHACSVVGKGGSLMLSVGGYPETKGFPQSWQDKDPWPQGLGILDLNGLTWKTNYDPSAPAYVTPEVMQKWYAGGGLDRVSWSSDEVKGFFYSKSSNNTSGGGTSSSSGGSSVGAIVGGVVGGVAVVALVAGVVFFFLRRRRAKRVPAAAAGANGDPYAQYPNAGHTQQPYGPYHGSPLSYQQSLKPKENSYEPLEMGTTNSYQEMDAGQRRTTEIDGRQAQDQQVVHEMYAPSATAQAPGQRGHVQQS